MQHYIARIAGKLTPDDETVKVFSKVNANFAKLK